MGWFASQLLVYLVAAFVLGLLTGYLLWIFGWKQRAAGASSAGAGAPARATAVLVDAEHTNGARDETSDADDGELDDEGGEEALLARVVQLEAGLGERTDELAALRSELDARSRELDQRRNEVVAARARADALEAELHDVGDARDAAEARAAELAAARAEAPAPTAGTDVAAAVHDPDGEAVERLRQANELLTAVLAERDRELADARAVAQQERDTTAEQLDRLWSRLGAGLDERTGLEDRLAAARLDAAHRVTEDDRARAQRDEATAGLAAARSELEHTRTELEHTRTELEATRTELEATRTELATAEREAGRLQRALEEAASRPQPAAVGARAGADPLERIEGIGTKIATVLRAGGIDTFAAIAGLDDAELRRALAAGGVRSHPSLPTWRAQAALLAAGDEAAFAALRDELVAGRARRPKDAKVGR